MERAEVETRNTDSGRLRIAMGGVAEEEENGGWKSGKDKGARG